MADTPYRQTVEEAARLLDERAIVFEERTRARMRDAARALRSGLADHERAVKEECAGTAANVLAVYRRHFSDPRLAEECRSEIVRALRTHPPSPEPVPAATEAGTEPFCACGRRVSECDGSRAGCLEEGSRD